MNLYKKTAATKMLTLAGLETIQGIYDKWTLTTL